MKTKIYSYVRQITDLEDPDYNKFRTLCISECGNVYDNETYETEAEAKQAVFQNIKSFLNDIDATGWYTIIETKPGSPEIKEAMNYHSLFSNPSKWSTLKFKLNSFKLTVEIYWNWIKTIFQ